MALAVMLVVIPIFSLVTAINVYTDSFASTNPYVLLILCYSTSTVLASIRMLIEVKSIVFDTRVWVAKRRSEKGDNRV